MGSWSERQEVKKEVKEKGRSYSTGGRRKEKEKVQEEKYYSKYKALLEAGFAMIPERKKK